MNTNELQTQIREQLLADNYLTDRVDIAMIVINRKWKQIYRDGGLDPKDKSQFEDYQLDFDYINNIVQTIVN